MEINIANRKLKIGDIIVVSTVLTGQSEYPVIKVDGNKAITRFRVFNTKIYEGGNIYEYNKRPDQTTNGYWLKDESNKEGEEII